MSTWVSHVSPIATLYRTQLTNAKRANFRNNSENIITLVPRFALDVSLAELLFALYLSWIRYLTFYQVTTYGV